jgi:hypothetical protein
LWFTTFLEGTKLETLWLLARITQYLVVLEEKKREKERKIGKKNC